MYNILYISHNASNILHVIVVNVIGNVISYNRQIIFY